MSAVSLLDLASDWTGQTYEERLKLAAETLCVHGYLQPADMRRIANRIRASAQIQRDSRGLTTDLLDEIAKAAAHRFHSASPRPLTLRECIAAELADQQVELRRKSHG